MPNRETFKVKAKYRSWDGDILSKLRVPERRTPSLSPEEEDFDGTQTSARLQPDLIQTSTRLDSDLTQTSTSLKTLSQLQRKIFEYLLHLCNCRGDNYTGIIFTKHLANSLNINYNSLKTCFECLEKKGLIFRLNGKRCRNGYTALGIHENIKFEANNYYNQT